MQHRDTQHIAAKPDAEAPVQQRIVICDRCGSRMIEQQCKISCPNCGNRFDCSDLNIYFD